MPIVRAMTVPVPPSAPVPVVGVSACRRTWEDTFVVHWVMQRNLEAILEASGCVPLAVPAMARHFPDGAIDSILDRLDGLLLTGSPSNVEPHHYGAEPFEGDLNDPDRDATTLPLIRGAVRRGIPVLAICRGIQELNVAMGGSLYGKLHEAPGHRDHRSDKTRPRGVRSAREHPVAISGQGLLRRIIDADRIVVNTLHAQGIREPAPGARINAVADDGVIEAIEFPESTGFVLGVQWHPEITHDTDENSRALFEAFGAAVRAYAGADAAGGLLTAAE
ncbi:MAG: gamma-glutamyl-gamma-aminobutyrate hydrolase family protein [Rhodospirillaceae bacterium]|nr:gamma-glutamyl-gamma-aminobutyrate hydrolase family protein [Rhodospirillaceae bacterium]MYF87378.1 gamma-glutamyl-gamma-aminobutyrate hydrolase family protein [Rhodospirillaceae bacterium]MYH38591.1 gamma-glutamyl-gamma-aminobutyrate hydrolase family protein [Rhodospirillaceae bacterium]MYK13753.1 gamma-glutamyl-gamma-aminobutyrate hydrolase family protein [Rhodospirillaceae bacterium]MYK59863.1 gamma-glutamyl-gamma-aminobutyrate hydrolase family protein [Rhodospirillaceae bacterium]